VIFSSALYLLFFAVVFILHWYVLPALIENKKGLLVARHRMLLAVSYFFYMSWDWRFGFLMAFSTLVDYFIALGIDRNRHRTANRKRLLLVSILVNLGVLAYFKYSDFFIGSFVDLINFIVPGTFSDAERNSVLLHVILPLGISFFTFQSMSYTIDVYRKVIPVEKSLLRFSLFVSFFPQLVAGPIVVAKEFLPQLQKNPVLDLDRLRVAARWFLLGYFKKTVLADNVAPLVDTVFRVPDHFSGYEHWVGGVGFLVQIYGDFSGYSDMAWGSAMALGYNLPENFRLPYLSASYTELWQRWHISLIRWVRDYVYIPLGGNRVSAIRHKFNIFAIMFLSGVWHGANWTYIFWGSAHGLLLVIENLFTTWKKKRFPSKKGDSAPGVIGTSIRALQIVLTISGATFLNSFFRATTLSDSFLIMKRMIGLDTTVTTLPAPSLYTPILYGALTILVGHLLGRMIFEKRSFRYDPPPWLELLAAPFLFLVLTQIAASDVEAFIYFVF